MSERRVLPQRRRCETFEMAFGGLTKGHTITVGVFEDGSLGEVFISGGKSGEMVEAIARDGAVLLSMALQHGVSLDTIKHSITRDSFGRPLSIVGAVVDQLKGADHERSAHHRSAFDAGAEAQRADAVGQEGSAQRDEGPEG
jgi:ribonucleoside-diphosphate reductase alpha chain